MVNTPKSWAVYPVNNDSIVYVWEFNADNELKDLARMLTSDFETELINSERYMVLERKRYDRIVAHRNLQDRISDIEHVPSSALDSLRSIQANVVVFGEVLDDESSGEFEITVTFQKLNSVILKKESILIRRALVKDNQSRKEHMKSLVLKLHFRELLALQQEQYESVNKIFKWYLLKVKNVKNEFQQMTQFAFDNSGYFNELNKKIVEYNEIFEIINNNQETYTLDFTKSWNASVASDLQQIFTKILDDIHRPHILRLDKIRTQIAKAGRNNRKREEILSSVDDITQDLSTQIEITEQIINSFLDELKDEMNP